MTLILSTIEVEVLAITLMITASVLSLIFYIYIYYERTKKN